MKALQTSMHGDGTGRSGVSGAVPSAEASNDPCCPGQRMGWERVSQTLGPPVDRWSEGLEHVEVFGLEGRRGGTLVSTATSMNELHAHHCGAQRNDGELAQGRGRFDLAFFNAKTLALEGSEELLDVPALAVVGDGLVCRRGGRDGSARYEPPMDRLDACRGINLANVEGIERDALGQVAIGAVCRSRDADRTKAQDHLGATSGTAGNGGQVEREALGDGQTVEIGEQVATVGQRAISLGAYQQFDVARPARKGRVEIALDQRRR